MGDVAPLSGSLVAAASAASSATRAGVRCGVCGSVATKGDGQDWSCGLEGSTIGGIKINMI